MEGIVLEDRLDRIEGPKAKGAEKEAWAHNTETNTDTTIARDVDCAQAKRCPPGSGCECHVPSIPINSQWLQK